MISRSVKQQSLLNAYWVPINFQTAALLTIGVPAVLLRIATAHHTQALAILASVSAALSIIVPPIAGAISDHFRRRGGLRRPFILAGAVVNVAGLLWMSYPSSVSVFAAALFVAVVGQSISLAAYQPLIPEAVHPSEWGLSSGYQGIAALVGTVLGLGIAGFAPNPGLIFIITALIVVIGSAMAAMTPERPYIDDSERARIGSWRDFIIALTSRSFINFGLTLLMTFALYFFHDVLHVQNPSASTGIFGGLSLLGAVVTSLWMGQLSDRFSRKGIVALAGVPMALAILIFALAPQTRGIIFIALLFGLGYGAFVSTGWALAIDSVPQLRDVARDLGLWGLASGLPAIAAPACGGWLLTHFENSLEGYRALFFLTAGCFVVGSIIVMFIGQRDGLRAGKGLS